MINVSGLGKKGKFRKNKQQQREYVAAAKGGKNGYPNALIARKSPKSQPNPSQWV